MKTVKVTRTIEYVGPEDWVDGVLERSVLSVDKPTRFGHNSSIQCVKEEREEVKGNEDD